MSGRSAQRLSRAWRAVTGLPKLERWLDDIRINQGRMLAAMNSGLQGSALSDYEFRVFSQWGEDGIIQFLAGELDVGNRCFIEFGVEDFTESNCRFLMMKDRWPGFVIDGSGRNVERLRSSYYFWQYPLECVESFVTRENIASLIGRSGFGDEPGILSIDIDGVDYYVLEALGHLRPTILIVEYNALFGKERAVSVPYDPGFVRTRKHHSNVYFGASLPAFVHLASARGYAFVGVNSVGSNAFFVRRDRLRGRVRETTLEAGFRDSTFREARDAAGALTFQAGAARRKVMAQMPLVDVITGEALTVADLEA